MANDRRKRAVWRVLTAVAFATVLACTIAWGVSPWRLDRLRSNAFDHLMIIESKSQWLSVQFNEYMPG